MFVYIENPTLPSLRSHYGLYGLVLKQLKRHMDDSSVTMVKESSIGEDRDTEVTNQLVGETNAKGGNMEVGKTREETTRGDTKLG